MRGVRWTAIRGTAQRLDLALAIDSPPKPAPSPSASGRASATIEIRKLYRSYVMNHDALLVVQAIAASRRARPPSFFRNGRSLNFQSAQLASLYVMYGLLGGTDSGLEPRYRMGSLESGTLALSSLRRHTSSLHSPHEHFLRTCVVFSCLHSHGATKSEIFALRPMCGGSAICTMCWPDTRLACGTCGPHGRGRGCVRGVRPAPVIGLRRALLESGNAAKECLRRSPTWNRAAQFAAGSCVVRRPRSPMSASRAIPVWNSRNLIAEGRGPARGAYLELTHIPSERRNRRGAHLAGPIPARPIISPTKSSRSNRRRCWPGTRFEDLRRRRFGIADRRSRNSWVTRAPYHLLAAAANRFCGTCGAQTVSAKKAGHMARVQQPKLPS